VKIVTNLIKIGRLIAVINAEKVNVINVVGNAANVTRYVINVNL
tara:strand:+ start:62 stop:193 length:132 start_codon:yes stop_codon:yes gene_type:complete